ncbi:MAG: type II secretion system F family protein, partial [Saccharofermentanales bacterium]
MKESRKLLPIYLLIAAALYILSIPFIGAIPLRVLACALLAVPVLMSLRRYFLSRSSMLAREELKSLMEYLCTAVASGRILANAFIDAADELVLLYGDRSHTVIALKRFEEKIKLGTGFCEALACLASEIRCPEAVPLFDALSKSDLLGTKVLVILRHNLTMVSELLSVSRDISSDVSQKRMEATIMSGMPFLVIWCLRISADGYLSSAFSRPIGTVLFLFSFCLSVLAYCASMFIISSSVSIRSTGGNTHSFLSLLSLIASVFTRICNRKKGAANLFQKFGSLLPSAFILSRRRMLKYLDPDGPDPIAEYLFIKSALLLIALLFCIMTLPV